MVKRTVFASILFLLLSLFSMYLAYNIHYLLLGETIKCSAALSDFREVWNGLQQPEIRSFFLIFESFSALSALYAFVGRSIIKNAGMTRVTPEIKTPKAEGQGQFGSSRWMKKSEYKKTFKLVSISKLQKEAGYNERHIYGNDAESKKDLHD